jgi:hypothetical protein
VAEQVIRKAECAVLAVCERGVDYRRGINTAAAQ